MYGSCVRMYVCKCEGMEVWTFFYVHTSIPSHTLSLCSIFAPRQHVTPTPSVHSPAIDRAGPAGLGQLRPLRDIGRAAAAAGWRAGHGAAAGGGPGLAPA